MVILLAALGALFTIAGWIGFFGGLPALIFWGLAALCYLGAWSLRSGWQKRRETRMERRTDSSMPKEE